MNDSPKDPIKSEQELKRNQEEMRLETRRFRHQTNTLLKLGLFEDLPEPIQFK